MLSFDIDWAPDWAVQDCAALCSRYGWKATFFATHASQTIPWLDSQPGIEVGIHPNFMPASTQGKTPQAVLESCLEIVPGATSMRTHGFIGSNNLSSLIASDFPQLQVDTSVFLPFHRALQPTIRHFQNGRKLTILPTWLSDMACAAFPGWSWGRLPPTVSGTCLVNVHPIHLVLNSADSQAYTALRRGQGNTALNELTRDDIKAFVNHDDGVRTWLRNLMERRCNAVPGTVTEFVSARGTPT